MYLFRIHIRPGGGSADMDATFAYCLENQILGVGWRISGHNTKDWNEYFQAASTVHGNLQVCAYIHKWVGEGDLVWTRDTHGEYFLARVKSGWEYWTTQESEGKDIDIGNVFRCEIKPVPIDSVPGKVVACFRASRSIQEIASQSALEYSKHLWNELAESSVYEIDNSLCEDIFMLLDDQETEDVVFLYLQSRGMYVLPHSRKKDTMAFEYLVIDPKSGQPAAVQVKTGGAYINLDDYKKSSVPVFLFQSQDCYSGTKNSNVTIIPSCEIADFLSSSNNCLPAVVRKKISMIAKQRTGMRIDTITINGRI